MSQWHSVWSVLSVTSAGPLDLGCSDASPAHDGGPHILSGCFIGWWRKRGVIAPLSSLTGRAGSWHPKTVMGSIMGDLAVYGGGFLSGCGR